MPRPPPLKPNKPTKQMASPPPQDGLNDAVFDAVQTMNTDQKAALLLETSLSMIQSGLYGEKVERYLEVYLRTPGISTTDITRAQLARANARRLAAERLLSQAHQDYQAVTALDPANREAIDQLRRDKLIHFMSEPAYQRAPLEIWDRIARYIPRYHLRAWLSISSFHRQIAQRHIFHTLDLYFGDDQLDNVNKGLDIFSRVKKDPGFAKLIKTLRIHWAYEEGDILDLMQRLFREALPAFTALEEFEWIGYPELRDENVKEMLQSHPNLQSLGLIGWHFDAEGVSAFCNLHKFTLRAEDDDGWADMGEVRTVLDNNERTLRHLCLGAYLKREHSWDRAFGSVTVQNLTQLDLVDTRISHVVLSRISHARGLRSLTLHGTFEEPGAAGVVFGSDCVLFDGGVGRDGMGGKGGREGREGRHTFLPHLEAFRFVLVGHDDDRALFESVIRFVKDRPRLRRLDLGNCPWDLLQGVLPTLTGLAVLRVRIANLTDGAVERLVSVLPKRQMVGIHLSCVTAAGRGMEGYAGMFRVFEGLGILHLSGVGWRRPVVGEREWRVRTEGWVECVRGIARAVPSLDFVGWHGEHFVVVRGGGGGGGGGSGGSGGGGIGGAGLEGEYKNVIEGALDVDVRDLPARRRLDCGTGVDLGGEDAAWLERKDVPIDYEMPGLELEG